MHVTLALRSHGAECDVLSASCFEYALCYATFLRAIRFGWSCFATSVFDPPAFLEAYAPFSWAIAWAAAVHKPHAPRTLRLLRD